MTPPLSEKRILTDGLLITYFIQLLLIYSKIYKLNIFLVINDYL